MAPIEFCQPPSLFDLWHHGPEPGLGFHNGPATTCGGDSFRRPKKHSAPIDIKHFIKPVLRNHHGAAIHAVRCDKDTVMPSFKYPVPRGKEIEEREESCCGLSLSGSGTTLREVLSTTFSES